MTPYEIQEEIQHLRDKQKTMRMWRRLIPDVIQLGVATNEQLDAFDKHFRLTGDQLAEIQNKIRYYENLLKTSSED